LLNYLWGDDFIHIWRVSHLNLTLDVLAEKEKASVLQNLFSSVGA
jgi:hypothetical protein